MPSENLIDFDTLDLSTVIAGPEVLDQYREQRGRFSMLDGLLYEDVDAKLVIGYKDIRKDDWWAADHIPARPLFPGALMCESAAQLGTYDFLKNRGGAALNKFVGFGGMDDVRFRGMVEPDCRLIIVAYLRRFRTQMFIYECQGFVEGNRVFEAVIRGVVI